MAIQFFQGYNSTASSFGWQEVMFELAALHRKICNNRVFLYIRVSLR